MTRKKRILRKFKLSEISPVDRPAQGPALAVLMKRADEEGQDLAKVTFDEALAGMKAEHRLHEALEGMWELNDALRRSVTSIVENPDEYPDPVSAVRQSLQDFSEAVASMIAEAIDEVAENDDLTAEDEENPTKTEMGKRFPASDFALVPDPQKPSTWKLRLTSTPGGEPDPLLVGAAAAVLSPDLEVTKNLVSEEARGNVVDLIKSAWPDDIELPEVLKTQESPTMTKKTGGEPTVEDLQGELAKRDEQLKRANALAELTDVQKAHFNTLDEAGQNDFLAKSADQREAIVKNLADQNPVIYKSDDGEEFRKNDDPRLVRMAKQADEDRKLAKQEREARVEAELAKRAGDELGHLPGEDSAKIALLKAVDSIQDKNTREAAGAILKASDANIAKSMTRLGSSAGGDSTAQGQLEEMVKRYQEDNKDVSEAEAYDAVLKTDEGKRLYTETLS